VYKFGDASEYGFGFGSSLSIEGRVYYSARQWEDWCSMESSNYGEFSNIIHAIEKAHEECLLHNTKLFFFHRQQEGGSSILQWNIHLQKII